MRKRAQRRSWTTTARSGPSRDSSSRRSDGIRRRAADGRESRRATCPEQGGFTMPSKGQRVRFLYRGSFPDGRTFDDCKGVPHEIVLGRRQVMKALEETLSAMEPGEERILELSPAEAYGAYDESALQRVPTYRIPNGENLPVGQMIAWKTPRSAEPVPATVVSVENQVATLDFNHPLAGKDLVYWVKLIDVVPAAGDPTA
ncbi:hypothetical protein GKE55_11520 [Gordonibacter pamelaeae]|nr:hypothetical protein [Gordonibacter pamelaeae]